MSRKKPAGANTEPGSALLWDCFVNWALTMEKIRENPDEAAQAG